MLRVCGCDLADNVLDDDGVVEHDLARIDARHLQGDHLVLVLVLERQKARKPVVAGLELHTNRVLEHGQNLICAGGRRANDDLGVNDVGEARALDAEYLALRLVKLGVASRDGGVSQHDGNADSVVSCAL